MTTATKAPALISKEEHRAHEGVIIALIALRQTFVALANAAATSADPATRGLAAVMSSNFDQLDYATSLLAGRVGWSIVDDGTKGHGASVPADVSDAVARWAVRGKRDAII